MKHVTMGLGLGALLLVGGCYSNTGTTATGMPAMGARTTAPGAASQAPQSPNSLPAGSTVSAPITPGVGRVGTSSY